MLFSITYETRWISDCLGKTQVRPRGGVCCWNQPVRAMHSLTPSCCALCCCGAAVRGVFDRALGYLLPEPAAKPLGRCAPCWLLQRFRGRPTSCASVPQNPTACSSLLRRCTRLAGVTSKVGRAIGRDDDVGVAKLIRMTFFVAMLAFCATWGFYLVTGPRPAAMAVSSSQFLPAHRRSWVFSAGRAMASEGCLRGYAGDRIVRAAVPLCPDPGGGFVPIPRRGGLRHHPGAFHPVCSLSPSLPAPTGPDTSRGCDMPRVCSTCGCTSASSSGLGSSPQSRSAMRTVTQSIVDPAAESCCPAY